MNDVMEKKKFIKMSYDEWCEIYKPVVNHLDKNASFDNGEGGIMFETYGEELEFIKSKPQENIWTYGDGDNGKTYIWNGLSFVNRIGYFITELPCPDNLEIQIKIAD